MNSSANTTTHTSRRFGMIGLVLGFLALATAFLTPYISAYIDPPTETLEARVADSAMEIFGRLKSSSQDETFSPEVEAAGKGDLSPSFHLAFAVTLAGVFAAGFGSLAQVLREEPWIAMSAIILGVGAAFVKLSIILICGIIFALLVVAAVAAMAKGGV